MPKTTSKEFVLGLDVGTSSAKVCVLDFGGQLLGGENATYPTIVPKPAWAEQEPDAWLPALGTACRRLLGRLGLDGANARGLAITSAAHIGVLLDGHGHVLRPAILWNDQRSKVESEELSLRHGEKIFGLANNWPAPTWTLSHLLWIARNDPAVWNKVRHFLLSKDYIAYRLTGRMASDPAAAVSALLYDVKTQDWSAWLAALAGLPDGALPEILPISAPIGPLSPEGVDLLGLSQKTIVFNGTMDSTAETFSAGVRREGECVIRLASAGGIHGISASPRAHPKLISYPYPIAPFWLSQAGTNTCASAVAWARQLLQGGDTNEPDFDAWTRLAEQAPAGANGLLFHPYLAGERCPYWDGSLRASFIGLGLNHGKADLARAVYEGTAYALRDALGVLEAQGFSLSRVKLVGGGARSALWCQTVSNVLACPAQAVPEADSSVGAALLALVGLGVFADAAEVPAGLCTPDLAPQLVPDERRRSAYDDAFALYQEVQAKLAPIYHLKWPIFRSAR
ncbi:xylulokinase [Telmatospirillum siberiense]|uniref:Xylulokinase n=1 Tax=Telmatospirillum siberiense TaxID=382514 RepID=A0A2N3PQM8_9PROT|nr:FGGY family carbohydrate kinase [Telmatospirillum siberiense]PKU22706.1 hypothetical protein CWS72_20480 [Telmatospirillum siberiense]